jgi:4-alpha-glucanotransferase
MRTLAPTGCRGRNGFSGSLRFNFVPPATNSTWSTTLRWASTRGEPTPGRGRTWSRPGSPWARRRINLAGQGWGLAAWDPHRLRASGYDAFIQTVRAALKFGGGLRYDHVMGLFRLFWIPDGAGPADGTYVRYPADDLLDILALESHRSRAYVVGEDLGTVEPAVRAEMAVRGMLGYRVLWFEDGPPEEYPQNALATVTNHDLPTVAGMWTGADLEDQRRAGITPNEDGELRVRDRLARLAGLVAGAPAEEAVDAAYALLSRAPSRLVTATLEDAIGVIERPNVPGTTDDERPNWSLALPLSLEEIEDHPGPRRIANILRRSFT